MPFNCSCLTRKGQLFLWAMIKLEIQRKITKVRMVVGLNLKIFKHLFNTRCFLSTDSFPIRNLWADARPRRKSWLYESDGASPSEREWGKKTFNFVVIFGWISRDGKLGSSDRQRGVSQRINQPAGNIRLEAPCIFCCCAFVGFWLF